MSSFTVKHQARTSKNEPMVVKGTNIYPSHLNAKIGHKTQGRIKEVEMELIDQIMNQISDYVTDPMAVSNCLLLPENKGLYDNEARKRGK